ncbi:MAG: FAD-dependent oxidoreductase [Steroidobacteraceae bacterium]
MRIAIVGSGIAGLTTAHRLHRVHDITLFEAGDHVGGHTNTVDVDWHGRHYAIDTGFIVFNDWTYPNFIALLDELGVGYQHSNMSFSLSCERTGLEYNGTSVNSLFAQRRNLANPEFLRMIVDILRFNSSSRRLLQSENETMTLGEYLANAGYSESFRARYIVPMGKAIWSATESALLGFPARFFVDFFERHGFLNINNRPVWQAIEGGSREYVRKLTAPFPRAIRTSTPVVGIKRDAAGVTVRTARGDVERFDYVVLACHSDQALAILQQPTPQEREILAAFPYQANEAVLHTDTRMLPLNPRARAAWNYHSLARDMDRVALTYDMNLLQSLTADEVFLVTLNRAADIDPRRVIRTMQYHHPVYLPAGVAAQKRRRAISGSNRTFYCGAYWRDGFHEDGVVSAQWALEDFARVAGRQAATGELRLARAG